MTKTTSADWLRLARDDIVVAKEAHKKGVYHLACFHAQQAAEKLLKACLIHANLSVPKTHSLIELYEKVKRMPCPDPYQKVCRSRHTHGRR